MYAEQQALTQQEAAETAAVQVARESYAKRNAANAPDFSSSSSSDSSDSSSEPDLDGEAGAAARAASDAAAASYTRGNDDNDDDTDDGGGDEEGEDGPKLASCEQAVACMAQAGLLPGSDHALLAELVDADHFIVKAAWDYYQVNPRLEELADTLVQLVRIESQRRGLEQAQAAADAKAAQDEVDANAAAVKAAQEATSTAAGAQAPPSSAAGGANSESSGPVLDAVPPLFAKVLISALDMEVLTKAQVVCFVEKFTAGDELVKAAWAIFEMQNDVKELIDTLFRIYAVYQEKETMETRYNEARAEADAASNEAAQGANGAEEVEEEEDDDDDDETPSAGEGDDGMGQLMAILNQCMELLEKREELKAQQAAQEGGPQRPPLTAEACAAVKALGRAKDPLLIAVLADFSEKRDVEQLLNHLYVIALETQAGGAQGALDRAKAAAEEEEEEEEEEQEEVKEEKYDFERRAQEAESGSPTESSNSLQLSVVQQMGMIVEAMLQEGLVDELEKQALEVLVLKQDPTLVAAFQEFSGAQTSAQKLELLEQLSTTLRTRARQELDRLRASIAAGEDEDDDADAEEVDEDDDDDEEFVSGGLRGVSGASASNRTTSSSNSSQESPVRHVVTITEDEDSYEESDTSTDSFDPNVAGGASHNSSSSESGSDPLAAMTSALASTLDHLGLPAPVKASLMACDDQGRALIIAAIDVFQQTKDVEDLKDTLKRVARHQQDAEHLASLEVRRLDISSLNTYQPALSCSVWR